MRLVTDQALHRQGKRSQKMKSGLMEIILRRELATEFRSPGDPEHPQNDGEVSEPYIIIVMGQL